MRFTSRLAGLYAAAFLVLTTVGTTAVSNGAAETTLQAPAELANLPEIRSVNGVAYVRLTAALDPATKLPAFIYRGAMIPPTIRVRPGDTLVIDYTNALPAASGPIMDMSNLHTHGLMVSPQAPGDQVIMTMIMPGQRYRYVINIPRNQPPGLYWYHPHPHGESNRQVASGMSGLIVVDGIDRYAPIASGLVERDIILRDYYLDPSLAPLARHRQRAVMRAAALARADNPALDPATAIRAAASHASTLPAVSAGCDPDGASKGVTINGQSSATISMNPGTRQVFRVANASANSFFDLRVPGSKLLLIASDGVPLSFHDRWLQAQYVEHVLLAPGNRSEFILQTPLHATALESSCIDYGPDGDVDPARRLAEIRIGGEPPLGHVAAGAILHDAEPFGDINRAPIAARRVVNFTENNPDSMFYINGKLWDPSAPPMFSVHAGTVEEWTVANYADELHAFHIHQIHFLVEDINGVRQPKSAWRDTIAIPYAKTVGGGRVQPGVVHLLMDFRDPIIAGTFVFHCHILEHEDGGMMAKIQVLGPKPSTAAIARSAYHQGFLR